jgi:tRNA threonylcarbamoyladenosine biosynthesis protein TsaE
MEYSCTYNELSKAAAAFEKYKNDYTVFLFSGEQGSGKTTLIGEIIRNWWEDVPDFGSPTYSIMNEYVVKGIRIFHFDWYRVRHPAELEEAGISEFMGMPGTFSFIEWPESGMYLLKNFSYVHFFLSRNEEVLSIRTELHHAGKP